MTAQPSQCNLCDSTEAAYVFTKRAHRLVRCGGCGLLRVDPMPDPDRVAALYAPESGYQSHRLRPQKTRYSLFEARRDAQLTEIVGEPPASGARLLDVGCATGTFLLQARSLGWQVNGLEPGVHLAAFARATYGLDVAMAGAEDAAQRFEAASFDVITVWDVIEHLRRPLHVMRTLRSLLKPGGTLYVATPNEDGWVPRFHWRVMRPLLGVWPHPEPPRHLYQFSRSTIARLFTTAGFDALQFRHDEIPLWYTSGFADAQAPHPWLTYLLTAPVFAAARLARRGDSMIVCGRM